ncbi:orotate phosphoribosyltransferase [Candidatus Micrarchaeota archaeon]|nr:orotate phosphoribosyltransferase [Candidatus Micrarchaeota archaeon]MBU2477095.1 orotate phosphoribosyltransferase [Candidatus Micrarchaeota archaeon]
MKEYKKEFIEFLAENNALKFGEFTLKSGRKSPYFINTGMFKDGKGVSKLGEFYAKAIKDNFSDFDVLFGPAYKGIPLCVSTVMKLNELELNKGYAFNRKEAKDHGEKGNVIGETLEGKKVLIIDDVITAGTAVKETIEVLKENGNPKISGIIISVNRKEKGSGEKSAIQELEESLSIKIACIVDFDEIAEYLHNRKINGKVILDDTMHEKMMEYKKEYGVK